MVEKQALHNLQWIKEAPAVHALVHEQLSSRLEQLYRQEDRLWLKKEASKAALEVVAKLNRCIEESLPLPHYQDLHQELLALLRELKLDQSVTEKIVEIFGAACVFMKEMTSEVIT